MLKELQKVVYTEPPAGGAVAQFAAKLGNWVVSPEPSNAAPGTSDHGRGTAVDFVVMKAGKVVADTSTSPNSYAIWRGPHRWEEKLMAACKGSRLRGPLKSPDEPWHWVLGA